MMHHLVEQSPSVEIAAQMQPYIALVEAQEQGGLERAQGNALFAQAAKGAVSRDTARAYAARATGEAMALAQFRATAAAEHLDWFGETVQGAAVDRVAALRGVLAQIDASATAPGSRRKSGSTPRPRGWI